MLERVTATAIINQTHNLRNAAMIIIMERMRGGIKENLMVFHFNISAM